MSWHDSNEQSGWRDAYGDYGRQPYSQGYGPEPQDTPPPGYAQDPYAQQNAYAQDPYAQDPYAQYAYAQDPYARYDQAAYPPPAPARPGAPALTVAALVANIASAILCCGIGVAWIPGVVLSAIALSRNSTDPDGARKLTIGAWICFVADLILTVVAFVLIGVFTDDHSGGTY